MRSRMKPSGKPEWGHWEQVMKGDTKQLLGIWLEPRLWPQPLSFQRPSTRAAAGEAGERPPGIAPGSEWD